MQLKSKSGDKGCGITAVTRESIRNDYEDVSFFEHRIKKDKGKKSKDSDEEEPVYVTRELPFVDRWLKDREKLKCTSMCFDPSRPPGVVLDGGDTVFNTWGGFYAEGLNPVSKSKEIEAMEYIENFIFTVTGDKPFTTYMMDWFANIIQHPESKTQVAILLQGPMGCGKSAIFNLWRAIVGERASSATGKPAEDYFSRFSAGLKNMLIAQVCPTQLSHKSRVLYS